MDYKGIGWAGNAYEKFQAMCLEVEDAMHEDSAKYVENQVDKVGVSVKKFYTEVLVDLIPPSCINPIRRAAAADFPLEPYTQTDTNQKPNSTISDIHCRGEVNPIRVTAAADLPLEPYTETDTYQKPNSTISDIHDEGEGICDLTAEGSTPSVCDDAKHLSTMSRRVLVGNTQSDECSKKSKAAAGLTRRSVGIKRIYLPPKMSRATTSLSGDGIVQSGIKSNCLMASDDLNVTRPSEFFVRHDSGKAVTKNTPISDASVESCNSNQILSAESVKQEKNDSECTCTAPDKDLSSAESHGFPPAPIDSFDIEVIETEDVEKSGMEESCVMVERDELHFVSQGTKKHKSYKKKIYDVLSSQLRLRKKQGQCVSNYEDSSETNNAGAMSPALTMDCDKRTLPTAHSSCDFGWELLELQ